MRSCPDAARKTSQFMCSASCGAAVSRLYRPPFSIVVELGATEFRCELVRVVGMDRDEPGVSERIGQAPQIVDSRMPRGVNDREGDTTRGKPCLRPLARGLSEIPLPLRPQRPRAFEAARFLKLWPHGGAEEKSEPSRLAGELVRENSSVANLVHAIELARFLYLNPL